MNFNRLEQNIIDVMTEQQLKLGYRSEVVRLYYPLLSLNRFLGTEYDAVQMKAALDEFCEYASERLGRITITNKKDRFCFVMPPQAGDYVHEHADENGFLYELIKQVEKHGVTINDVLDIFKKYSDEVHFEQVDNGEFDYLVYFEDGRPDDFRYCITDEGAHVIYHRYTKEDYEDFGF
ncbi:MAG: DUF3877 family protein [Lachnospiraceae bacterium]|nr:DUF3877 family protein [Lachnospiraceae bacterium]